MSQRVFTFLFLLFLVPLLLSFCVWYRSTESSDDHHGEYLRNVKIETVPCRKPHFVLVHGYGGAAWGWYKIRALLETFGYTVTCVDLKSAGLDPSDACEVHTFEEYNKPLINFMANLSDHEKVILVGHSAGGLSLTDASHKFGKKIGAAIYVAATMLKHGYMTDQDKKDGALAGILKNLVNYTCVSTTSKDRNVAHKGPREEEVLGSILWRPGVSLEALMDAQFKGNGADDVRRVYIRTRYDHVLIPEQQTAMIRKWPPAETYFVDSDHSPHSSDPFVLAGLLAKAADSIECSRYKMEYEALKP